MPALCYNIAIKVSVLSYTHFLISYLYTQKFNNEFILNALLECISLTEHIVVILT